MVLRFNPGGPRADIKRIVIEQVTKKSSSRVELGVSYTGISVYGLYKTMTGRLIYARADTILIRGNIVLESRSDLGVTGCCNLSSYVCFYGGR